MLTNTFEIRNPCLVMILYGYDISESGIGYFPSLYGLFTHKMGLLSSISFIFYGDEDPPHKLHFKKNIPSFAHKWWKKYILYYKKGKSYDKEEHYFWNFFVEIIWFKSIVSGINIQRGREK